MSAVNPKCGSCKCYWIPDETDVKSSGLVCKTCKKCRTLQKQKRLVLKQPVIHKLSNFLDMLNDDLLDAISHQVQRCKFQDVMKDLKYHFQDKEKIEKHREKYMTFIHQYQEEQEVRTEELFDDIQAFQLWLYQQKEIPNKEFIEMYCLRLLKSMEFFYYIGVLNAEEPCFDIDNLFEDTKNTVEQHFILLERERLNMIRERENMLRERLNMIRGELNNEVSEEEEEEEEEEEILVFT